jgi:branched-chain amino acid transport system substrate-binding protein
LPLSGGEVANGGPTLDGALLAIAEANVAGGVRGYTIASNVQDDAVSGVHNPDQGAHNVQTLIADPTVVAVVGPFNSNVARAEIPITNAVSIPQCSPANTAIDLTKEGSEVHRPERPDVRNYFRVAVPDDIQGAADAQYAYIDLGGRAAYVVDDTEAFGVGVANAFVDEFERLGGTIVKRDGNDYSTNTSFVSLLTAAQALNPDVVYFGGTQVTGGGQLRKDMGQLGMLDIPMVGPDGITDLGAGGNEGAFITLAGVENSDNVYGTVAALHDIPDPEAFNQAFGLAHNGAAPGAYSAPAYACTQIILAAVGAALDNGADPADPDAFREAVRAQVFSGTQFDTVLGPVSIDANGDNSQKIISFYETDPSLNDGKGGWTFIRQTDYAGGFSSAPPAGSPAAESAAP